MNRHQFETFQSYLEMLAQLELLAQTKKIRNDSIDSNDGANQASQQAQKSKEQVEEELNDESLCPICFNRTKDTKYVPCAHISCKVCIQTHMLNK